MKGSYFSDTYEFQSLEAQSLASNHHFNASTDQLERAYGPKLWPQPRFSGWRGGIVAATVLLSLTLIVNVIVAILAAVKWNTGDGISTLFLGDCDLTSQYTLVIHLFINAMSSLLLGASNYCMQRLVAPTREEVDKAHAKHKWLAIGRPSLRNLSSISRRRLILWILLACTSVPIHLLYNSTFFQSTSSYSMEFLAVSEKFFVEPANATLGQYAPLSMPEAFRLQQLLLNGQYLNRTTFANITTKECQTRYSAQFIKTGPGFGVVNSTSESQYMITNHVTWPNVSRYVDRNLTFHDETSVGPNLAFKHFNFSYCLSQNLPPAKCAIQASQTILYVVITCTILKLSIMIFVLKYLSDEETLVTIGDAIQSFLQKPDSTTENCCLMSRKTVHRLWKAPSQVQRNQKFHPSKHHRWAMAYDSKGRNLPIFFYVIAALITGSYALATARASLHSFGKVDLDNVVGLSVPLSKVSIIPWILCANMPQLFVSALFLLYNGQFTTMLAHREWSNYATKRAPLRVTVPLRNQRSTYYIQIPFTFGIPLMLAAILLHWLLSQSLFLVRTVTYQVANPGQAVLNPSATTIGGYVSNLGYSYAAILTSLIWGLVLVIIIVAVMYVCKYPVGLPIGGTNSAVISAACHAGPKETANGDMTDQPLKWGVIIPGSEDIVGHCSFSSEHVDFPQPGHLYAGISGKVKTREKQTRVNNRI